MKMHDYMKRRQDRACNVLRKSVAAILEYASLLFGSRKTVIALLIPLLLIPIVALLAIHRDNTLVALGEEDIIELASTPIAISSAKKGTIVIPNGTVKANPFVPYRNLGDTNSVPDVPSYNLVEPPEIIDANSNAARVMDTIVSGILYDRFNPSAILNIEGNDYLVKKGDVVNNYKVLNILQDSVTVKLGNNVYKAGIGEILTEGTLHKNDVSNLSNKFGGVRK